MLCCNQLAMVLVLLLMTWNVVDTNMMVLAKTKTDLFVLLYLPRYLSRQCTEMGTAWYSAHGVLYVALWTVLGCRSTVFTP